MKWTPINPNAYQENPVQHTRWTEGTIRCYELNKDCYNCLNHRITDGRLSWGSQPTCFMPVAVQSFLDAGIFPSTENSNQRVSDLALSRTTTKEVKTAAHYLRLEIVSFLQGGENSIDEIVFHLNASQFKGKLWRRPVVREQVYRLKYRGVLDHAGFVGSARLYCVTNPALVDEMAPVGMAEVG